MLKSKVFHCMVDDTALVTNISEIETWVLRGAIALVVPLHTLERLHLLKKDTSQIGQNARKAVKFLDDATSNPDAKVFIQEPDDQYSTWSEVEAHYVEAAPAASQQKLNIQGSDSHLGENRGDMKDNNGGQERRDANNPNMDQNELTQQLSNKMTISKNINVSPLSTPPLSPSSSGIQSSKTSPEVKSATLITHDLSPVPPALKGLINSVVWYTHEKFPANTTKNIVFLTNSADTAYLARDFGVVPKNIHQLRAAIGVEEQEAKNHDKYQKKHGGPKAPKISAEPKTLFRYEDEESEEEEVVFKPRGRGSTNRSINVVRGGNTGSVRSKGLGHSPANSLNGLPAPAPAPALPKPQIPTEEIDPDSFDRGGFARGSTPLASIGNHASNNSNGVSRGLQFRGNHTSSSSVRGGYNRGGSRGSDRGSARGRGRLFVP